MSVNASMYTRDSPINNVCKCIHVYKRWHGPNTILLQCGVKEKTVNVLCRLFEEEEKQSSTATYCIRALTTSSNRY